MCIRDRVSALCALLGVSATGELINSKTLELETQTVTAVSLLSKEGVVYMLTSMVSNFTSFAPLGVVLVTMLGIGCAEGSGYLSALLKKMVDVYKRQAPSCAAAASALCFSFITWYPN